MFTEQQNNCLCDAHRLVSLCILPCTWDYLLLPLIFSELFAPLFKPSLLCANPSVLESVSLCVCCYDSSSTSQEAKAKLDLLTPSTSHHKDDSDLEEIHPDKSLCVPQSAAHVFLTSKDSLVSCVIFSVCCYYLKIFTHSTHTILVPPNKQSFLHLWYTQYI